MARVLLFPFVAAFVVGSSLLLRNRSIRIVLMDSRYFGHQCLEAEVFWNEWKSAKDSGSRDIWLCSLGKRADASNRTLWDLRRRQLPVVPSWFVSGLVFWHECLKPRNVLISHASIHRLNFLRSRATTLPINSVMEVRRREILSNFANPNAPYSVFTIRDYEPKHDPRDLRNRRIQEFLPAMQALVDQGMNVIRLTVATDDRIQVESPGILDWRVRVEGQSGDELVIVSGAEFVVSTTTGGDALALAYRRPVLYVDSSRLRITFLGADLATFQMPKIEDITSGRQLTFRDIVDRGLYIVRDSRTFAEMGVRVCNSDAESIESHVLEYYKMFKHPEDINDRERQQIWREYLMRAHQSEILSDHGSIRARMHPTSLRDYVNVDAIRPRT
jgi:putative glycosyltransferase (TIGR04372 family)